MSGDGVADAGGSVVVVVAAAVCKSSQLPPRLCVGLGSLVHVPPQAILLHRLYIRPSNGYREGHDTRRKRDSAAACLVRQADKLVEWKPLPCHYQRSLFTPVTIRCSYLQNHCAHISLTNTQLAVSHSKMPCAAHHLRFYTGCTAVGIRWPRHRSKHHGRRGLGLAASHR